MNSMKIEPQQPIADDHVLRLKNCIKCGYDLRGNPAAGRCSECGALYDLSTFDIIGWTYMPKRRLLAESLLPGLSALVGGFFFLRGVLHSFNGFDLGCGGVGLLLGSIGLYTLLRSLRNREPIGQPWIVTVQKQGVAIHFLHEFEDGELLLNSWPNYAEVETAQINDRLWRIRVMSPTPGRRTSERSDHALFDLCVHMPIHQVKMLVDELRRRIANAGVE